MASDNDSYERLRRRILWSIVNGLYLVGSRYDSDRNVMTCSFVTQVATEPKLVGIGVERESKSANLIEQGGSFTLMFLGRGQKDIVRKFVKPAICDIDKSEINGYLYQDAPVTKAPILQDIPAFIECSVYTKVDFASHTFFIGEVINAEFVNTSLDPSYEEAIALDANKVLEVLRMEDTRMHYGG